MIQDANGSVGWSSTVPSVALISGDSEARTRTVRGVAVGVASIVVNAGGTLGWYFIRVYPADRSATPVANVVSFVIEEYTGVLESAYMPLVDVVASEPLELYRIDFNIPGLPAAFTSVCGDVSLIPGKAYTLFEDDRYGLGWSGPHARPINEADAMFWFRNASGKVSVVAARAPITSATNAISSAEQLYYAWDFC